MLSPRVPSRQFLPVSAFGAKLAEGAATSTFKRDLVGETGRVAVGRRQTLTCRRPVLKNELINCQVLPSDQTYVTKVWPTQHISLINEVHLFAECNLADPFLRFTVHMKRNPSFGLPSVAKY